MKQTDLNQENNSPFHIGEQRIQARVDKREQMEAFGRQVIRSYMPAQHRDFFAQLPFIIVGSVDQHSWPWASILTGEPGFINSPDPTTLQIHSKVLEGDPLKNSIKQDAALGLLGIDLAMRRRNRLNVRIDQADEKGFSMKVDQSFGNCPQYIQSRHIENVDEATIKTRNKEVVPLKTLDDSSRIMIKTADTFFVSSFVESEDRPDIQGVDVSHRGGQPGFVKVDGDTLTIPDYSGNNHFNTLGNFLLNPKAGLIFTDFESGDLLMLTGTVEILWEDEPEVVAFKGAERAWRFTLDHGLWLKQALPFQLIFDDYSANMMMTGNWVQAANTLAAEEKRKAWRSYCVTRVEDESSVVRSFYFKPTDDDDGLLPFRAGQFLTLRIKQKNASKPSIRTYTVSSAPEDEFYRISVKREIDGQVSNHLHTNLKVGDIIEAKAPSGDFFIDSGEVRPAVLLAGGIGITPMMSMAQHIANEGKRTRHCRPLTVLHAAKTTAQRAFGDTLKQLQNKTDGRIRYYSFISQAAENESPGVDFNAVGRIDEDALRQILALDDYDFYLCGPESFMQAVYNSLRNLGVKDRRIFAEAFGPASLSRQVDEDNKSVVNDSEASQAVIKFSKSGFKQRWSAGDASLLEVAESHGITAEFGCRNGVCGTCVTKLISGSVAYRSEPSTEHKPDEVLICCAVPAKGTETLELAL